MYLIHDEKTCKMELTQKMLDEFGIKWRFF
jgi:hypothetical protein